MRILIAGAGITGRRLVEELASGRNEIVVIDLDRDVCEAISSEFGVVAIQGNATDITILEEAEISRIDVAVGLMRASADNLAFSLLARGAGVERIIARMPNPKYRAAYERAGVTTILDVAGMFIDRLVFEIERPRVWGADGAIGPDADAIRRGEVSVSPLRLGALDTAFGEGALPAHLGSFFRAEAEPKDDRLSGFESGRGPSGDVHVPRK